MRGAAVIPVTTPRTSVQELARRVADGVEVTLLWSKRTNTVFLRV
jgi:antitoxin (DNA-binding transcriptional repressor) of toxin-antitoxin stability system